MRLTGKGKTWDRYILIQNKYDSLICCHCKQQALCNLLPLATAMQSYIDCNNPKIIFNFCHIFHIIPIFENRMSKLSHILCFIDSHFQLIIFKSLHDYKWLNINTKPYLCNKKECIGHWGNSFEPCQHTQQLAT